MAIVIDGKAVARELRAEVKARVLRLKTRGIVPGLAMVIAGENPASEIYVANKAKACGWVGVASTVKRFSGDVAEAELLEEIQRLNADESVHSILVQLPLPAHISEQRVLGAISPEKDADGFHPLNIGSLFTGADAPVSCTPAGCIELLKRVNVPLTGAHAVVVGRSNIVGKPAALLLLRENCTVTICHSRTGGLADILKTADIVIAAVGKPGIITGDMLKPGCAVIDVGINRLPDGRIVGDVDFASAAKVAGWITPVPGGVGPMTIAMLLKNVTKAAEKRG